MIHTGGLKPYNSKVSMIFRVVGLPDERLEIRPPHIIVNGAIVAEPTIFQTISNREKGYIGFQHIQNNTGISGDEVYLGDSEYYVLGDNSDTAVDSRYFGALPEENIIGRAIRIYWPLSRIMELVPN